MFSYFDSNIAITSFVYSNEFAVLKSPNIAQERYKYASSPHENFQLSLIALERKYGMKILNFSRKVFRCYGLLPLDGEDFDRFKWLEYFRIVLLPFPSFLMGIAQLAYFVVNIRDLGKATVALYCGFGFMNSIFGYSVAIYHRRNFLKLLNDMQTTTDQSKTRTFFALISCT